MTSENSAGAGSPLATPDQQAVELAAVRLLGEPVVQAAIAETGQYFQDKIPHGPRTAARFAVEYPQAVFNALLGAVNADPNRPRVHAVGLFGHRVGDVEIPPTKALHPNPDYIYRLVPVDGTARFVLRGRRPAAGPLAFEVSLLGDNQVTFGNLSISDLVFAPDGAFEITIDPGEKNGRANHLQSRPGALQLIIRDVFDDIAGERPMALSIERLDPPVRPAPTEAELIASAGPAIRKVIDGLLGLARVLQGPPNTLAQPGFQNQAETLVTQAYSIGHLKVTDEEALIIRLTCGSAAYAVVPLTSFWGGIGDFLHHRTSIGTSRAEPDPDGAYTFVVSVRDPGVANWVDTDGLDEGVLCVRWLGFAPGGPAPTLDARVVRLADLDASLPPGTPRCDAAARHAQLSAHSRDYTAW